MKRKNKPISISLPYVKIYRDEIEEIIAILEESEPKKIEFEARDKIFSYDEIDKLNSNDISNLVISAKYDWIQSFNIDFYRFGVNIFDTHSDHPIKYKGIASEIEQLLKQKKKYFIIFSKLEFTSIGKKIYKNTIFLKYKKDTPHFFERNKDYIINFFIAMISFLLGKFL
ncbi:MAG: hypothetical protein KAT32_01730 [Candidatus Moranbacteria bacterium]|nr:hypothetical protein [Candidatus Moranbacteria bacterium]